MFEAFSTAETEYVLDDFVTLEGIRYEDCRVRVTNGSTFTINTPGRYYIAFNAVGSSTVAASPFALQLVINGDDVPGVRSEITSTAADDPQDMSFSTIVNVMPSNCFINNTVRIQIQVDSEDPGTITSANLVIFRLK